MAKASRNLLIGNRSFKGSSDVNLVNLCLTPVQLLAKLNLPPKRVRRFTYAYSQPVSAQRAKACPQED